MSWITQKINWRRQKINQITHRSFVKWDKSWVEKCHETPKVLERKTWQCVSFLLIDSFSKILKEAKDGRKDEIGSDPFYTKKETESFGYELRMVICPNGFDNDKKTHLSVFMVLMKGEYDAILRWPFNKKVKFTLID